MKTKLACVGLFLVLVGLVGVVPVAAQDDASSAPDGEGEELLAKALVLLDTAVVLQEGQSLIPVRVDVVARYTNDNDSFPPELDLPDLEWVIQMLVGAKGPLAESSFTVSLRPYNWVPGPDDQRARALFDTLDELTTRIVLGDNLYSSTSTRALAFGRSLPPACARFPGGYWVKDAPRPGSFNPEDVLGLVITSFMDQSSFPDEPSASTYGSVENMRRLLGLASDVRIVGQETIRGVETTRLRFEATAGEIFIAHSMFGVQLLISSLILGNELLLPPPEFLAYLADPNFVLPFDIWLGDDGKIHRTSSGLGAVWVEYLKATYPELEVDEEALKFTVVSDTSYLDESPHISPPPDSHVIDTDEINECRLTTEQPSTGDTDAPDPAASGDGDGAGPGDGGLADTGVNTLVLVIVGLGAVLAGAMVLGLSRRLRTE